MDDPPFDPGAVADMLLSLARAPEAKRLSTLAMVMKVFIEGHLPRFEDILRREAVEANGHPV